MLEEGAVRDEVWSDEALERLDEDLRKIDEAVLASELALSLLTGASLPKQVRSCAKVDIGFTSLAALLRRAYRRRLCCPQDSARCPDLPLYRSSR
jgi:hypothetical protein